MKIHFKINSLIGFLGLILTIIKVTNRNFVYCSPETNVPIVENRIISLEFRENRKLVNDEKVASEFYEKYIHDAEKVVQKIMMARWNMLVNMNETNRKAYVNQLFIFYIL